MADTPDINDLQDSQRRQQKRIDELIAQLDKDVSKAGEALVKKLVKEFVEALDIDKGAIISNAQNLRLVSVIDKLYDQFNDKENLRLISTMTGAIQEVNSLNADHFQKLYTKPIAPMEKDISSIVSARFGIKPDGTLMRDGYMMGLLDDNTVRRSIKDFASKAITTSTGWADFRNKLGEYVEGNKDQVGIFKRFYRNYAYDVYSQADRLNSFQYAERLDLNYAVYEGGLIKTSRQFCIDRNGKVYTREEIMKWKLTEAVPPNYDPIIDLGGYGCRHYLNWISYELAVILRPDLKKAAA